MMRLHVQPGWLVVPCLVATAIAHAFTADTTAVLTASQHYITTETSVNFTLQVTGGGGVIAPNPSGNATIWMCPPGGTTYTQVATVVVPRTALPQVGTANVSIPGTLGCYTFVAHVPTPSGTIVTAPPEPVTRLQINVTRPTGGANGPEKFVFNADLPNGKVAVPGTISLGAGDVAAAFGGGRVHIGMPTLGGVACEWTVDTFRAINEAMAVTQCVNGTTYATATCEYRELPASNAEFGLKYMGYEVFDPERYMGQMSPKLAQGNGAFELFYTRDATNHPGGDTPNWYYYWKADNVCGVTSGWEYEADGGYGSYTYGEDHVNAHDLAPTTNNGPETFTKDDGVTTVTVTGNGEGPYCCAETIAHEMTHKAIYETWAEGIGDGTLQDPDGDGVPTGAAGEGGYLGITSDPNDSDTFNMAATPGYAGYQDYGDNEVRCRKKELNTGYTVDPTKDWACPGLNY